MAIIIRLDRVMADRKIRLIDLADKIGITYANLSNLKNGKVSAIRFSTLENICKVLDCQPGDILEYTDNNNKGTIIGENKATNWEDDNIFEDVLIYSRYKQILNDDNFELSLDYLKSIHKNLFKGIEPSAGKIRKKDIVNNDSVSYIKYKLIEKNIVNDIHIEKGIDYKTIDPMDAVINLSEFTSNLWYAYPFESGNVITISLFIEKYLLSLGYNVDYNLFIDNFNYFKNALIRSVYYNQSLDLPRDYGFLYKFYGNLILGQNNNLDI